MNFVKKTLITLIGTLLLVLGLVFVILPGPAILVIPVALAILALEYPIARKWLKGFQRSSRKMAVKLDRKFSR